MCIRLGKLDLQIPQTRDISFYPSVLEKALALAVAEMYVNGVSTKRVKRINEELCGLEISSFQVSTLSKTLDFGQAGALIKANTWWIYHR